MPREGLPLNPISKHLWVFGIKFFYRESQKLDIGMPRTELLQIYRTLMPKLVSTGEQLELAGGSLNSENVEVQEFIGKLEAKRSKEYHCKRCYQLFKIQENTTVSVCAV